MVNTFFSDTFVACTNIWIQDILREQKVSTSASRLKISPWRSTADSKMCAGYSFYVHHLIGRIQRYECRIYHRKITSRLPRWSIGLLQYHVRVFGASCDRFPNPKPSHFTLATSLSSPIYIVKNYGWLQIFIRVVTSFLSTILVLALWLPARGNVPYILFAAFYGFSSGAFVSLAPALIGQISDIRQIGIRIGTMCKCSLVDPLQIAEL